MDHSRFRHVDDYKKNWLDWWLSDEPPPADLEPQLRAPYVPPADSSPEFKPSSVNDRLTDISQPTSITINVHVPKIKVPDIKKADWQALTAKASRGVWGRATVFAVVMMLAGLATHSYLIKPPVSKQVPESSHVLAASTQNKVATTIPVASTGSQSQSSASNLNTQNMPTSSAGSRASFTPVAPASKPELGAYAFAKTSYDSSTGIYTYLDTIGGSPFSVSEQTIPSVYHSEQEAVDKISASINAQESILASKGIAHIYTDTKSGQQTIILSMNGILVSINSRFQHPATAWKDYIATLR